MSMALGVRLWDNGKMVYPLSFTTNLKAKSKGTLSTKYEGDDYQVKDNGYMSAAPFMAVNGYIYEDDVVTNGQSTGIVKFDVRHGMFMLYFDEKGDTSVPMEDIGVIKILGNIHENPELLKTLKAGEEAIKGEPVSAAPIEEEEISEQESTEAVIPDVQAEESEKQEISEDASVTEESVSDEVEPSEADIKADDSPVEEEEEPVLDIPEIGEEELISANPDAISVDDPFEELADNEPEAPEEEPELPDAPEEPISESEKRLENIQAAERRPRIDIYLAVYTIKEEKKAAFAYSVYKDHEKIKEFAKFLNNTDFIKGPVVAVRDVLSHLPVEGDIIIHSNASVVYKPFVSGLVDKWRDNGWKKENGKRINHTEEWNALYELLQEKQPEWDFYEKPEENTELGEQLSIANNKYNNS